MKKSSALLKTFGFMLLYAVISSIIFLLIITRIEKKSEPLIHKYIVDPILRKEQKEMMDKLLPLMDSIHLKVKKEKVQRIVNQKIYLYEKDKLASYDMQQLDSIIRSLSGLE